jgi:hypothetical protein
MPGSSRTAASSVGGWSDHPTEKQDYEDTLAGEDVGALGFKSYDRPLIDFGSDGEEETEERKEAEMNAGAEAEAGAGAGAGARQLSPSEKLQMLLQQMHGEVDGAVVITPSEPPSENSRYEDLTTSPTMHVDSLRSKWRNRRAHSSEERESSPASSPGLSPRHLEQDSPPTPPPRIMNPYLNGTRRTSAEARSATPPTARVPSRATVLHASKLLLLPASRC